MATNASYSYPQHPKEKEEQKAYIKGKNIFIYPESFTFNVQELFGPIYFLGIIIILKLVLKNPHFDPVLDPPGPVDVRLSPNLGEHNITIAPNDEDTKNFIVQINQEFQFDGVTFNFMEVLERKILLRTFKWKSMFQNEAAMDDAYEDNSASIFMGIIFNQTESELK